jgi:VCBS repeat-containing protein
MRPDGLVQPEGPAILAGADGSSLQVPEGFDLFGAQFARDGDDLILAAEGSPPLTVVDYFSVASPPDLVTAKGPMLTGDVVEMLAGPRAPAQYAQADAPEGAVPIGQVEALTGTSTATRATGETVELGRDDPVFQGDVIQTGPESTLGIRLEDGTLASMSANSRLVLNEFVFEAGGSDNWMLVNLVEGAFAFLTGAIAPSGGMEITTPVAVMAVRGTMPIAFVTGAEGATKFFAGSDKTYELLHLTTREILAIVSSESGVVLTDPNAPIQSIELDPQTLDEINELLDVLNDAAAELGLLGIQEGSTFHTYSPFGDIDGNLAALIEFLLLLDGSLTEEAVLEVADTDQFMMAEAELIANPDQDVTVEMTPVVIDVLANDIHPEGGDLTVIFANVPAGQGSVNIVDGQFVEYDPGDAFNYLALGETTDVIITYAIADSTGAVTSSTVTVTLNGINQAPQVDPVAPTNLDEQTDTDPLQTTVTVTFSDVDLNNVGHQAAVTGVVANGETGGLSLGNAALMALVTPGTVTKNAGENSGSAELNFSVASTVFDYLAHGEVVTLTYTVAIDDQDGGVTLQSFDVVMTGTNDAPVIVAGSTDASGAVTELADGDQSENGIDHVAQGTIAFSDVDLSDAHSAGVVAGGPGYLGSFALGAIDQASKTIGWTFTLADAAIDWLALGESLVQTYTVTIDDGNGGTVDQLVTVTITGTNDAPTIVAEATDASASVTELADTTGSSFEHVAAGSIAFADVDLSDAHSASFAPGDSGYLGTFSLGGVDAAGNTVGWTFTVTDSQIDHLPKDTTLIQTYVVTISDGNGGTVQQVVTITINGSNDAPVIVVDGDDVDSAVLEEADETLTADGTLTVSDVSVSDVVTAEVTAVAASGDHSTVVDTPTLLGFMQVTSPVIGSTDAVGTLIWNFDSNGEFFDFLANGETLVLTYTITVSDGTTTDTHPVTITILGTNDQPVITAETLTAPVAETLGTPAADATLGDSGSITFTDLDLSDAHSVTVTPQGTPLGTLVAQLTEIATGGGTGEITWTYAVDAGLVEYLAEGESLTETFEVTLSDGNGGSFTRTVTVTVTGSNDVPVITAGADVSGAILEGSGDLSETGAIAFTDVDQSDQLTVSADANTPVYTLADASTGALTPAQLAVLQAGFSLDQTSFANSGTVNWTYSVAESDIDFLGEGETVELSFTVTVTDLEGETAERVVTITITGANDGPVITAGADDTGAIVEGAGDLSETGAIAFTDVDQNDALTVSADATTAVYTLADATTGSLSGGQLAVLQAGFSIDQTSFANSGTVNWTYALAESDIDFLAAGETVELSFKVTVTDSQGVTAQQVVTITVNGTDDAPVISVETGDSAAGEIFEITGRTGSTFEHAVDGSLTFTDVDVSDDGHGVAAQFAGASGAVSGLTLTPAELNSLFSATIAQQTGSDGTVGQIDWQFAASDAAFDYLDVGETLVLTYSVMVTHPNGDSSAQEVTITVHGAAEGPIFDFVVEEFSGSHTDFRLLDVRTIGEDTIHLLLTPTNDSTKIDTSNNDVGIGGGDRKINPGEGVRIEVITNATVGENESLSFAAYMTALAFTATITGLIGGPATVFVRTVFADSDNGDQVTDILAVQVNGENREFEFSDDGIVIKGLESGDVLTILGAEPFTSVEIFNGADETNGGGDFLLTDIGFDVERITTGTDGNDFLLGTDGDDYIFGMDGDDVLMGLGGLNTLEGGPGNDLFVLTDLSIHDVIVDYGAGDVIDLTRLGFELAAGEFTAAAAGEFVQYDASTGELFVDVDGAAGPEPFVLAAELATSPSSVFVRLSDGDTTADVEIA